MSGGLSALLTVRCTHGYFGGGPCRALSLMPTAECARQLARYRLSFLSQPGGGTVYYQPGAGMLEHYTERAPLAFWLVNSDPALDSYTALDATVTGPGADGVFYFDNLDAVADETGTLRLNAVPDAQGKPQAQPPGSQQAPKLPVKGARFPLLPDQPVRAAQLALQPRLAGADGVPLWQARSPDASLASVPVALGAIAEGRYRLSVQGSSPVDFWLGPPPRPAWGVVAIYTGGKRQTDQVAPELRAIAPDGTVQARTYEIALTALALPWRYNIISQEGIDADWTKYELVATPVGKTPVRFTGQAGAAIGGRAVYQFVSDQPLPLAERPDEALGVQLRPGARARHVLPLVLAYPEPGNIRGEGDARYAEVYVHL